MSLGVNIGDLCCDDPWTPERIIKVFKNELKDVESVKFFHCNPSKIIPIGSFRKIRNIYMAVSNDELCTVKNWKRWITKNVRPIANRLRGKNLFLCVGNEVLFEHNRSKYGTKLLPAMRGCYRALNDCSLSHVKIVTPLDTSCLSTSYPPSEGKFRDDLVPILKEIVKFTVNARSKLAFNVYPFFARQHVSEDFALFGPDPGYVDNGKRYEDLFCAQYDSLVHAVSRLPVRHSNNLEIIVTETGWPSSGEHMANDRNTFRFTEGIKKVSKYGTPMRPGSKDCLLFELYDENLKTGPGFEKHFGVFTHEGREKV